MGGDLDFVRALLRRLDAVPETGSGAGGTLGLAAEHVRVAADHLGGDRRDDIGEGERLPCSSAMRA